VNPVIHSRSSERHFGGVWGDYIQIHHWLDRSKEFVADFRHRYNFHHEEGIQEAVGSLAMYWSCPVVALFLWPLCADNTFLKTVVVLYLQRNGGFRVCSEKTGSSESL